MDRMLDYTVQINEDGLRVEQFLRRRGYSRQNLVELKKMPLSILVNGSPRRLNEILTDMDTLTLDMHGKCISRNTSPPCRSLRFTFPWILSTKMRTSLSLINRPVCLYTRQSITIPIPWQTGWRGIIGNKGSLLSSAAPTGLTEILRD